MKRYVVMRDWNSEGWKIVGEDDTLLGASVLREKDLRYMGGGRVVVFAVVPLAEVYSAWDRPKTGEVIA